MAANSAASVASMVRGHGPFLSYGALFFTQARPVLAVGSRLL